MNSGSLIPSIIKFNSYQSGNPFRNNPYRYGSGVGYIVLNPSEFITFVLLQDYELNTLKIQTYDKDSRTYSLKVYAINEFGQTLIFDSTAALRTVKIHFKTQIVSKFIIYYRGGNNSGDPDLYIQKIVAAYFANFNY